MAWNSAVYDRTQEDVTSRLPKAFFNVADWVRISGNTEIVQTLLRLMRGVNVSLNALDQPTMYTIPTAAEVNRFVENIERLRSVAGFPVADVAPLKTNWSEGTSADAPDFEDANDWERDLDLMRTYLRTSSAAMLYAGTFNAGMDRVYANRWRQWFWYIPEAYDPKRYPRAGVSRTGQGRTFANRWRSPLDERIRTPRTGLAVCGAPLRCQNKFRRYK